MTVIPGMRAIDGLRLNGPVWGIDPSTLRMAAGILKPQNVALLPVATVHTSLLTLPAHKVLAMRQVMAVDAMTPWLRGLDADHGTPVRIGLEVPLGPTVPLTSFWVIGALIVSMGEVWGANCPELVTLNPGEHKKAATGVGREHPYRAAAGSDKQEKGRIRAQNRLHELGRIVTWARSVGYDGWQEDEAASLSVAVGAALWTPKKRKARG